MFNWFVIQSKPGQLLKAQAELEQQGFETYLPLLKTEQIKKGKRVEVEAPLFPGYLFIFLSKEESNWRPIRSTRGVAKLISFGSEPAIVPKDVVNAIRAQLRHTDAEQSFRKDDKVSISDGPFKDLQAVFIEYDGEQRAFVLMELLGRWQKMSVELSAIS
ncbi:transcription/translation regulatory transformer protein RfaH [Marinobacterium sp. LSUCC0821]|uniref:transcription/translation regulatory transformer protein RfaH n=1 Tax=Marinobacterium sp. LSUCC0821 TaxID=2668067 RepID=UPI0014515518|nr:transcription/translation regulatory transformer protein RfaH [Marinobacterium sp. LSUCC0821]QJD72144.1 transcription/translation regulatory transformer protein RfaH [Marinobacterium sp. LSUCC0821]